MIECKRCLLRETAENAAYSELEKIKERIEMIPEGERADENEYNRRLTECGKCDELVSGTCMKCGCYVEFRAAYLRLHCPNAGNRRW